jgi:hypothetical protein
MPLPATEAGQWARVTDDGVAAHGRVERAISLQAAAEEQIDAAAYAFEDLLAEVGPLLSVGARMAVSRPVCTAVSVPGPSVRRAEVSLAA